MGQADLTGATLNVRPKSVDRRPRPSPLAPRPGAVAAAALMAGPGGAIATPGARLGRGVEATWQPTGAPEKTIQQMEENLKQSQSPSVEDLNLALRLYRRLLLRLVAILVLGLAAIVGLSYLGTYLAPPYGLYVFGESLSTWGLVGLLVLLIAECWWEGRALGRALQDPILLRSPISALLSGLTVVAQRANAMNMEWSGFLGPLRPRRGQ